MFKKKKEQIEWQPPTEAVKYPSYTFIKVDNLFYLLLDETKKKFISERAFWTWNRFPVIGSKESTSKYVLNGKIGFRNGTLVQVFNDKYYYISNGEYHEINTPDFFGVLGFDIRFAIVISLEELNAHKEGRPINSI